MDTGDLAGVIFTHLLLELSEVAGAIGRQRVAAVHKGVDEDAIDALLLGLFNRA